MICTSLQNKSFDEIESILEGGMVEMAEIRLDRCPLSIEDIKELFSFSDVPLIATCRIGEMMGSISRREAEALAEERLIAAIEAGAKYADLEIEAPAPMGKRIRRACSEYGTILIRSSHDFSGTPPAATLWSIYDRCRAFGGDVAKIVVSATSWADCERVLDLYEYAGEGASTLVAFAMGEAGRKSRLDCLGLGSPFTYACLSSSEATAPGQWTTAAMVSAVEANCGDAGLIKFEGKGLVMPASKSFAQRAVIAAALADGTSRLEGYSPCGDNESAISVARALGAEVKLLGEGTLVIKGIGAAPGSLSLKEINTGESGFLTRLMIPVMSAVADGPVRINGERTLLKRPLAGAHDIMASFGVRLIPDDVAPDAESIPESRKSDCFIPLTVKGPIFPGKAEIDGKEGSQLISGLLAALPLMDEKSTLYVENPRSIPYMFITLDVLKKFGIIVGSEMEGDDKFIENQDWSLCSGVTFKIKGGQRYRAADFRIEGDWSGAAAFLVAGAIFGSVEIEGLDTTSLQADISIMDILLEAGASMSQTESQDGSPSTGPIHVRKAPLSPFEADLNNCPDLFPVVSVLAAFCPGESHLLGVNRLRHKETDRAAAIVEMLTRLGVPVVVDDDMMAIKGMSLTQRIMTGNLLKGGKYTSWKDHRMVMALSVASLGADGPIEIDDTECVSKSFPKFIEMFSNAIQR